MRVAKHTALAGVVAVVLAGAITGVALTASPAPKKLDTLLLPTTPGLITYVQEWIAFQQNYFRNHGLNVELINTPQTTSLQLASLESGQIDIWLTGVSTLAAARQAGHDVKFVCGIDPDIEEGIELPASSSLPTVTGSNVQTAIQALKGQSIGVPSIGGQAMLDAVLALQAGGLSQNDVSWVGVGAQATATAALQNGSVNAIVTYAGLTQALAAQGIGKLDLLYRRDIPASFGKYMSVGFVAQGSYIQSHADVLKRFCAAIQDADNFARSKGSGPRLQQILETQMDSSTAKLIVKGTYVTHLDWRISNASLTNALNAAVQLNQIKPGDSFQTLVWSGAPTMP
jgi:NitT/TauT family transport system substrate-binding protein